MITKKTKLIFINFPSNPTGGVASNDNLFSDYNINSFSLNSRIRVSFEKTLFGRLDFLGEVDYHR
jgi:hypothetical protein